MENSSSRSSRGIGRTIGSAIGGAVDTAFDTALGSVGRVGKLLGSSLRLPGLHHQGAPAPRIEPGTPPGIAHLAGVDRPPEPGAVIIQCTDYCEERIESFAVQDAQALLSQPIPDWVGVRWINVAGLHPYIVDRFREALGFHILAAEDVLRAPQRPRVESYGDHLFIVTRIVSLQEERLVSEQISLFLQPRLLVTFQQSREELWKPIRDRLSDPKARIRQRDASYLAYALLDAVVDHGFPILERYGDALEASEEAVISSSSSPSSSAEVLQRVHAIKRNLAVLRRVYWPTRELVAQLSREDQIVVSEVTRTYLRDVYDHCVQILDLIETFREMASSLTDLYMSVTSNRTNEVMRVLTIMATIFIPATFLAGVYGMNFEHMPELRMRFAYPAFWAACAIMVGGLVWFFRRKGWLAAKERRAA